MFGGVEQKLVGMGRGAEPVQQPLKGVAGQDQIEVLSGLAGAGEQSGPHRSGRVALSEEWPGESEMWPGTG